MPARQHSYHHGNLREACLKEGLAILDREGKEAVSLRDVARRCRVSPRAPYQHFANRAAFLAALAERGFSEFGYAMKMALARCESSSPPTRIRALANAYLDFASTRPSLMRLMFGDDFEDRAIRNPKLHLAALATFEQLEIEIAKLSPGSKTETHRVNATLAWSMVHGLAELMQHGQIRHIFPDRDPTEELLVAAVALFGDRRF